MIKYHNIHVVYTREAETADQYIEKTVRTIAKNHRVTVATSDALEQVIILGSGAIRMSAAELKEELTVAGTQIRQLCQEKQQGRKQFLSEHLPRDLSMISEEIRRGRLEILAKTAGKE